MRRIVIIDKKTDFIDRLTSLLYLSDYTDMDIVGSLSSAADLHTVIDSKKPDIVAVEARIAALNQDWDYSGPAIVTYAKTKEDMGHIADLPLPTYGIVSGTEDLLEKLAGEIPEAVTSEPPETASSETGPQEDDPESQTGTPAHEDDDAPHTERLNKDMLKTQARDTHPDAAHQEEKRFCKHCGAQIVPADAVFCPKCGKRSEISAQETAANAGFAGAPGKDNRGDRGKTSKANEDRFSETTQSVRIRQPEHKQDTTVITVYAGKGGVGKTTISTETAVYLSLTAHARGTYRVCIVDFNIDFGDVRSTLGLDTKHADIYDWAMDIKDRIDAGEAIDDITYTREEMEEYLQKMDGTGLYALCAPLMHDESLDVEMEHLAVMLQNLKAYGDFDFIVCDTGNNTRDSSVTALREADIILLVGTQDLTTAMCNTSATEALEKFGEVDMSKICLVMNMCMSTKDTGISIQEVEDTFPYPCIARVPYERDVIRSNNTCVPVVYKAKHGVTKEIQAIAAYITGNPAAHAEKKKGGLKDRLRKLLDD